ncbi:MAG TPA: glycosyltransferase [Chthoniobacteraceae bacterium]|jgi:glycosyltransferase involved in cell wall biosynthesis|nr:glycosyltransferase [Chthoniobacteraceae bacterium]
MKNPRLRIAFIGTRGVPASYSGFETFVEQLGARLVDRGHEVVVFNRYPFVPLRGKYYRGMRIIRLRTIQKKSLDTLVHTFLSCLLLPLVRPDVVYICGVGNAIFCAMVRLLGIPVLINVDGEDWARKKWSGFAVKWLRSSEAWAARLATVVIADAKIIQERYQRIYKRETVLLPYGSNVELEPAGTQTLDTHGLIRERYVLFVGRLVPENRAELLIEAFRAVPRSSGIKLVIVGDAPYSDDYKAQLVSLADDRVIFTGYAFKEAYRELSKNCLFYVLASGVEGTRPVLLDQMGFGNCVLVRDTAANSDVVSDAGLKFEDAREKESLGEKMNYLIAHPDIVEEYRGRAVKRMKEAFSWEKVTDRYEALFMDVVTYK